jgi:hypothetical protein
MRKIMLSLVTLLALLVSCSPASNQETPTQIPTSPIPPTSQPTQAPTQSATQAPTLSGDPATIVSNALSILPTLTYRRTEWFAESANSVVDPSLPATMVGEFTPPDNFYVVWGTNEYLNLDGKAYSRQTGAAWTENASGADNQDTITALAAMIIQAIQSQSLTLQANGSETVAGVSCQVFTMTGQVDAGGVAVPISIKVWIGADGRLVKMEIDDPDTGTILDISLYEYDPTIQLPTP